LWRIDVPLSEHEQKMLEQMEQALAAEDPRFASQMKGSGFTGPRGRRAILGALGVLLGLGTVLAAVWTTQTWLGLVGFLVMVGAAVYALSAPKRPQLGVVSESGEVRPGRKPRGQSSFMDRLDERWDRREDGN
jgi:hypothetical protein